MQKTPVTRSGDVYSWTYEMPLLKNPGIFLLVAKVLFGTILGMGLVIMLPVMLISDGFHLATFAGWLKTLGIVCGIFAVLLILGYLLYAAIMGGKYVVDFTMDDKTLVHAQTPAQAKKAKQIGTAAVVLGILSKRPTTAGIGLTSQRSVSTTEFDRVKAVTVNRRTHTIKLRGGGANEVYANGDDFELVADRIRARVPESAKWTEK
ncbi:MAG: hypothetical protein IJT27_09610 [Clostridia bacterium]|nr:hypothetical protein [Clostridia bacterium]